MDNYLSVDVEDWFHILGLDELPPRAEWDRLPSRVEAATDRILALFDEHGVRATFFTLGWVAERRPALVRRIVAAGHELACHGQNHDLVFEIGRRAFRQDIRRARGLLEDISGQRVVGYRAPGFSIVPTTPWAFEELLEAGFRYDSTVFPAARGHGGAVGFPRFPYWQESAAGPIWEVPITTFALGPKNIAFAGGGYLRFFPYRMIEWGIRSLHRQGQPAMVYLHPREVDPEHPRLALPPGRRFKSYYALPSMLTKLQRLLGAFRWRPLVDSIPLNARPAQPSSAA